MCMWTCTLTAGMPTTRRKEATRRVATRGSASPIFRVHCRRAWRQRRRSAHPQKSARRRRHLMPMHLQQRSGRNRRRTTKDLQQFEARSLGDCCHNIPCNPVAPRLRSRFFRILERGKLSKRERGGWKSEKSGRSEIGAGREMPRLRSRFFGFYQLFSP